MSGIVTVEIKGLKEAQTALEQLPIRVAQKILHKALQQGINVIRTAARQTAPVGFYVDPRDVPPGHRKYGSLLQNIHTAFLVKDGLAMTVGLGVGAAYWGMFQEFGTRHLPARPWLRPAWDRSKEPATAQVVTVLGDGIMVEAESLAFHK